APNPEVRMLKNWTMRRPQSPLVVRSKASLAEAGVPVELAPAERAAAEPCTCKSHPASASA
ncbi:MAG: hypothetical protein ABIR02_02775, partial [Novosphingobium sp.]